MSSTFSIALSALQAQSEAINATGNNLANVNTDGFKGSITDFKSLFSEYLGVDAGFPVGLGVGVPISNTVFSQGAIQTSTSPLAAAIQGNGFFIVNESSGQQLFTRDGNFTVSPTGVLQTQTGETVQGWMADANGVINPNTIPANIVLPTGAVLPPVATKNMSTSGNLNADASAANGTNTFSTPVEVVDSLGNNHTLTIMFTQSTPNTWTYQVSIPGSDMSAGTSGTPYNLLTAPGTVSFNSDGTMSASTSSPIVININGLSDGAANMSINWSLFDPNGKGMLTQYAQTSSVGSTNQDGTQAAQLTNVSIENGGQVVATFSSGQQKVEAQLALAAIQNPNSLQNAGNNNFAATSNTAAPAIGQPQTGGRGAILGGAVEASNVDLATEFTHLITYQSAYQAASRVITTANQMDQDLLSLIHS
ncbi:MAG: flagellar hook protein FlgE [Acidobacteriaceae bacterium]|nr:flagellar hook protein FlgE [Acidobacteriaceae bacterium]